MNESQFIQWLKGFAAGVHHYNITPAQWDHLKENLQTVGNTPNADFTTGNWEMNHTWE
tara:strand:- start:1532 stop:1705 length:174 start_codon:yes stop_codon:yes gene_type:complete